MISTPHIQDIPGYLTAFYHGLPVRLQLLTSHFHLEDDYVEAEKSRRPCGGSHGMSG